MELTTRFAIDDASRVGEARRAATQLAKKHGLNEEEAGQAALITTELATNLVKHARDGVILMRGQDEHLEVVSIDSGPGIADIRKCLSDGYSSAGTSGTGLGAVKRQATLFDVYSDSERGTVISAAVGKSSAASRTGSFGVIRLPYPGETECGDGTAVSHKGHLSSILVSDGLGHGPLAAVASRDAIELFEQAPFRDPIVYLDDANTRLKGSRGAAISLVRIDSGQGSLVYAGVGNVCGHLIEGSSTRGLLNYNGTIGLRMTKANQTSYSWSDDSLLIMHTDGLSNRWSLGGYPGLAQSSPAVICGVLYRDFCRHRDDVAIVVVRLTRMEVSS